MSLESLKRRLEVKADAAALPPTAPAPPMSADQAMLEEDAAGGAAAAEMPAGSFAVDVEHDSETGGDDTPTRSATLYLSLPAAATSCGVASHSAAMHTLLSWLLTGRLMLGSRPGVAAR